MTDKIEDWAGKEACRRLNAEPDMAVVWDWLEDAQHGAVRALAKTIQQYMPKPADPLEEIAREAAMRHGCAPDGPVYRNHLAAVRRAYELGRSER